MCFSSEYQPVFIHDPACNKDILKACMKTNCINSYEALQTYVAGLSALKLCCWTSAPSANQWSSADTSASLPPDLPLSLLLDARRSQLSIIVSYSHLHSPLPLFSQ